MTDPAHVGEDPCPALSVVMAVYQGEPFLREAVDSVLAQSFTDYELLIVEDGSTDRTPEILAEYAARDARVRVLQNDRNRGLLYSRTRAFAESRAPLLAIADADDVFAPTRFERQVAFLRDHPDVGFVGASAGFIDEHGRRTGRSGLPTDDRDIRILSLLGGAMWDTSTMYRIDLVRSVGGYDEQIQGGGLDYDLWRRLLAVTRCYNLPEELVQVRVHRSSYTADLSNTLHYQVQVSRQMIESYLGSDVPRDMAHDALVLFTYGWRTIMAPDAIARAVTVFERIEARARQLEPEGTVRLFRSRVANAIAQQAGQQVGVRRALSVRLLRLAYRWDATVARRKTRSYLVRLLVPKRIGRAIRAILSFGRRSR